LSNRDENSDDDDEDRIAIKDENILATKKKSDKLASLIDKCNEIERERATESQKVAESNCKTESAASITSKVDLKRKKKFKKRSNQKSRNSPEQDGGSSEEDDLPLHDVARRIARDRRAQVMKSRRLSLNKVVERLHSVNSSAEENIENGRDNSKIPPIKDSQNVLHRRATDGSRDRKSGMSGVLSSSNMSRVTDGSSSESVLNVDFSPAAIKKRVSFDKQRL